MGWPTREYISVDELKALGKVLLPSYVIDADWEQPLYHFTQIPKDLVPSTLSGVMNYCNHRRLTEQEKVDCI